MELGNTARRAYTAEISHLEQEVLEMVGRAEVMFATAVDALARLDHGQAMEAIESDDDIDRQELDIEEKCLRMLALQQPMGTDLREIGTILKIITDIERIGDLSVDVAKIALKIEAVVGRADYVDLPKMAGAARSMLHVGIQSFVRRDVSQFAEVQRLEDAVDAQYRDLRGQIHDYMVANPDQVVAASWMLLAVHHIERVADHAMNIAERVGFMVTGELRQLASDIEPTGSA